MRPRARTLLARFGRKAENRVFEPEHRATQLRVAILEREIPVSGRGLREIRQLALHPDDPEPPLEKQADLPIQARNGEHIAPGFGAGLDAGRRHKNNHIMRFTGARLHRTIARLIHTAPVDTWFTLAASRATHNQLSAVIGRSWRILEEALTFDDVLLVPAYSEILPREVDLSTRVTRKIRLNLPLLSAAMDTVTEARLAITIAQEGGIGIIHKSMTIEAQALEVGRVKKFESGVIKGPDHGLS